MDSVTAVEAVKSLLFKHKHTLLITTVREDRLLKVASVEKRDL